MKGVAQAFLLLVCRLVWVSETRKSEVEYVWLFD